MMACSIGVQAANLWAPRQHPVGRQPALEHRRRRARHPDCDLPAAERGNGYSPDRLWDHRHHAGAGAGTIARAPSLSSKLVIDLAISLPALFAGSLLGIVAFRNNEI